MTAIFEYIGNFTPKLVSQKELDLLVRPRLLRGKVIRRKTANHQTLLAVRFVKRFEPRILRRETALRRNVDDQQNLALMFGKRSRRSVDALDRNIKKWEWLRS